MFYRDIGFETSGQSNLFSLRFLWNHVTGHTYACFDKQVNKYETLDKQKIC